MAGLIVSLFAELPEGETFTNYELGITNQGKGAEGSNPSFVIRNSSLNDWRRRITRHCLYGVDLNPLAVNLAKLSLWLNCFAGDHRLTFLDHHLRCGNSLIGIRSLTQLASIPERKKGKKKKADQGDNLFPDFRQYAAVLGEAGQDVHSINSLDEDDTDGQKAVLEQAENKIAALKPLADLYTAYLMDSTIQADDYNTLFYSLAKQQSVDNPLRPELPKILEKAKSYTERHHFFHWPLEFPDVFGSGNSSFIIHNSEFSRGFAATIGNPPWDIVKPNSQEFFSDYDPKFRSYKKQEANRISKKLMADNSAVAEKWEEYCDGFAEQNNYFKEPLSYSALGKGDVNTFKLFLEQFFTVLNDGGRMGIVVPSGIYTDKGCQPLRQRFFNQSRIEFLYCFENRWPTVFTAVDGRFKFVTFGTQKGGKTDRFQCAFMEHNPERLLLIDGNALKMSVNQVKKFSPTSLNVMEFKNQSEIEIATRLYNADCLVGDYFKAKWNTKFQREFHMTDDSPLFISNVTTEDHNLFPLLEGKQYWILSEGFNKPTYYMLKSDARIKRTTQNTRVV